ncbi:MAG TPA: TonB-dependent receptor [Pseudomonadales bacterium]
MGLTGGPSMNQTFELSARGRLARAVAAATRAATAAALVGATAAPAGVAAAEGVIEEIVVTVQRREESLGEVPLAVTAVTGEFIRDVNLDDVKDLVLYTPGFTGNSKDSFIDILNVRGVLTNDFGVGGDPSVSVFKNGLYQGRNGAVVTSFYDIDRAEVLRGPQSFLFGRNSIAGAISVHTRRPDFDGTSGYAELDVGQRNRIVAEGAVNVTLSENVAARLALYSANEDGYVDDVFDPSNDELIEQDKKAGRLSLRFQNDRTDVNFMAEYEDRKQSGSIYRATGKGETWETLQEIFGVELDGNGRDSDSDFGLGERDDGEVLSLGLEIEHDLGFATLTSLTGYKDHEFTYAEDFDGTPLAINDYAQDQEGDYFEQEFRLVSQTDGALSWYAGVSYYRENIDATFAQHGDEDVMCQYYSFAYYGTAYTCAEYYGSFTYSPDGLLERNRVKGEFEGWGAYVDLTYAFTDTLDASLGLRYSRDEKNFRLRAFDVDSELGPYFALGFTTVGFLEDTRDWDKLSPRLQVRWMPNDDWMAYGSVTTGYKSGGYGSFAIFPDVPFGTVGITPAEAIPDPFDPEEVLSYEIGTKGKLWDGRATLELIGYYYTYEDLQVTVGGQGGGILVENIGEVDGWGIESTFNVLLNDYVDVYLSVAWADTEANDVQAACDGTDLCEGNSLPELPELSYSAVLQGRLPVTGGEWIGRAELFGQTETGGSLEHDPAGEMDGYTELTLRAGYRSNAGWEVLGYVENVTDELYYDLAVNGSGILPAHFVGPSRPRTFGVRLSWEFQ